MYSNTFSPVGNTDNKAITMECDESCVCGKHALLLD